MKRLLDAYLKWYDHTTHRFGIHHYLPNTSTGLTMTELKDLKDNDWVTRGHWPMRLTQIVGGRTWSFSFIRFEGKGPVLTPAGWDVVRKRVAEDRRKASKPPAPESNCHPECALGDTDHPGYTAYRCQDSGGYSLPFPGEDDLRPAWRKTRG